VIQIGQKYIDDRIYGLTRGAVSGILAKPKHMKSTLTDAWMASAVENGARGLICSLEDPVEERVKRIVASKLRLSLKAMRFRQITLDVADIKRVFTSLLSDNLLIYDKRYVSTPEEVVQAINYVKPDIVLVDHIQKFIMADMILGIKNAIDLMEKSALQNNCHIILTSQVADKEFKFRKEPNPKSSDSMYNSSLYQSATELFGLYYKHVDTNNSYDKRLLELEILECRFSGERGKMILRVEPDFAQVQGEVLT
jgi:replicative DNA helicase